MEWSSSVKQTDSGEIPFHYTQLGELKNELEPDPFPVSEFARRTKVLSVTREYDTDIITLFHATGDFSFRHRWQEGVRKVEEISHWLPRVGARSRFIMEDRETVIRSSSYSYRPDHIEFSETDEGTQDLHYFTLEALDPARSRLTIDFYRNKSLLGGLLFDLTRKKKLEDAYQRSLANIEGLLKELPSFAMEL